MGADAAIAPLDYGCALNWVAEESRADVSAASYDLFYLYPTLVADRERPLMDLEDDNVIYKTIGFATAQIELFRGARPFAPYVRQLEYHRSMEHLLGERDHAALLDVGVRDTIAAFRHYLATWNAGRPYILFGHSQGAHDLYEAMRRCPEIAEDRGFVAAYLPGLPFTTPDKILADFDGRAIRPATGADDIGVIASWNTQTPDADNPVYSRSGAAIINPLNWRTDETVATAQENLGAVFYNYREINPRRRHGRKANFCGTRIDAAKGALIVDVPSNGYWDARGYVGKGVLHMNDFWFFAENVVANALVRVAAWRERHELRKGAPA